MIKKLLCIVLSALFVFGMMPISAFAYEEAETAEPEVIEKEAITEETEPFTEETEPVTQDIYPEAQAPQTESISETEIPEGTEHTYEETVCETSIPEEEKPFAETDIPANTSVLESTTYTSGYYTYTVSNGKATITDCSQSISGAVTIPSTLGDYPVTSIGSSAFYYCTRLTSVTIPNSVASIGSSAFYECTGLTDVTIGNSVKKLASLPSMNAQDLQV